MTQERVNHVIHTDSVEALRLPVEVIHKVPDAGSLRQEFESPHPPIELGPEFRHSGVSPSRTAPAAAPLTKTRSKLFLAPCLSWVIELGLVDEKIAASLEEIGIKIPVFPVVHHVEVGDRIVICKLDSRSWKVPGDSGESPRTAFLC